VAVLLHYKFSPDSDSEKKFANWSVFEAVIRRTKMCKFGATL